MHALTTVADLSFYTGNAIKVLPTAPCSSEFAVRTALWQLPCGHLAGSIAKEVVLRLMCSGVLQFAVQLAAEARSTSAGGASCDAANLALCCLYTVMDMMSHLPPALLPVPALDAHMSEVQVLGASVCMLAQPGPHPSEEWVEAFCHLTLSVTVALSQNESIMTVACSTY